MHLILTGATGLVGSAVLNYIQQHAIPAGEVSKLTILSRRPVAIANTTLPQVQVISHADFTTYAPELLDQLKGAHGCIWSIGVSQFAVPEDEYSHITIDLALKAAEAFSTLSSAFNFVYVSSDSATQEPGFFTLRMARIKGDAELRLLRLPESDPQFTSLRMFSVRPGGVNPRDDEATLDAYRNHRRRGYNPFVEKFLFPVINTVYPSGFTPSVGLGRVLFEIASGDGTALSAEDTLEGGRIIPNRAILRMISEFEG